MTIKLILSGTHWVLEPGSWQQCLWTTVSWSGLSWNHSAALVSCSEHALSCGSTGLPAEPSQPKAWPVRSLQAVLPHLHHFKCKIFRDWNGVERSGGTSGEVSDTECGQLLACLLCQWDVSRWVTMRICPRNSLQASLVRLFCYWQPWFGYEVMLIAARGSEAPAGRILEIVHIVACITP